MVEEDLLEDQEDQEVEEQVELEVDLEMVQMEMILYFQRSHLQEVEKVQL